MATGPMVQINTPYPATAYLKGFLRKKYGSEIQSVQFDPALELVERLFSPQGLDELAAKIRKRKKRPGPLAFFLDSLADYKTNAPLALSVLRGETQLPGKRVFPEGPRFLPLHEKGPYRSQVQSLEPSTRSRHHASLFLDDLADYYRLGDDEDFAFSRYGERLAASQIDFSPLYKKLLSKPSLVNAQLGQLTDHWLEKVKPDLFIVSLPFSGTVLGGLRMGAIAKSKGITVAMGGGYVNTELRKLEDPRVFEFTDFLSLDDGEMPLVSLIEHLRGERNAAELFRTLRKESGKVTLSKGRSTDRDFPFSATGTPCYEGLDPKRYIGLLESLNPVTQLWSKGFWNKLTLAHGCYWKKCTFCDTSLDYIGRYEIDTATAIVDKMDEIYSQTKINGFHFVDEAAPPAILKTVSEELIRRGRSYQWWGNIRFDKVFNRELTDKMAEAGCIAVTGGLEVASPRVLKLINKGVSLSQVARVTRAFRESGVLVHAYLMYGFPTQTTQETIDSLEVVRQLFRGTNIQSAFWHRFATTVHSPVGRAPESYGIKIVQQMAPPTGRFSENDLPFSDPTPTDHEGLGIGLKRALFNYMHGIGMDFHLQDWFDYPVPNTTLSPSYVTELERARDS
jgi:hypothetical protein